MTVGGIIVMLVGIWKSFDIEMQRCLGMTRIQRRGNCSPRLPKPRGLGYKHAARYMVVKGGLNDPWGNSTWCIPERNLPEAA